MKKNEQPIDVVIETDPQNKRVVVKEGVKAVLSFVRQWTESSGDAPYYIPADKVKEFMASLRRMNYKFRFVAGVGK